MRFLRLEEFVQQCPRVVGSSKTISYQSACCVPITWNNALHLGNTQQVFVG